MKLKPFFLVQVILGLCWASWAVLLVNGEEEVFDVPLDPNDFANGANVQDDISREQMDNILAEGGLFQGDLAYSLQEIQLLNMSMPNMRSAIKGKHYLWANGVVPYTISTSFTGSDRAVIANAIEQYKASTCIRFVPRTNQRAYIHITGGGGCSSLVGYTGDPQRVTLGRGCMYVGIVIHELMHAIGFWHEQSRMDRDNYVNIVKENIQPSMYYNFKKLTINQIDNIGSPYDACSVMHYGDTAFAKRYGLKTIVPVKALSCQIGQRTGLSPIDIKKINTLYNCKGYQKLTGVAPPSTTPAPTVPDKEEGGINKVVQIDHKHCAFWSTNGECQKNPKWMLPNCPIACGNTKTCADNNHHCESWAANGQCQKNKEYMDLYCYKSCHCQGQKCEDDDRDCATFKTSGYCEHKGGYGEYMKLKCRKTCGFC